VRVGVLDGRLEGKHEERSEDKGHKDHAEVKEQDVQAHQGHGREKYNSNPLPRLDTALSSFTIALLRTTNV